MSWSNSKRQRGQWQGRIQSSCGEAVAGLSTAFTALTYAREILAQGTHTLTPAQARLIDAIAKSIDDSRQSIMVLLDDIEDLRKNIEGLQ